METYILDRFEEGFGVLEDKNGLTHPVKKELLQGITEGDVVLFDGERYTPDRTQTEMRKKMIEEKMRRLFNKKG